MRVTRLTLLLVLLIIGIGFYRLADLLLKDIEAQTMQATEEVLIDAAQVLASMPVSKEVLSEGMEEAGRRGFQARVYELEKTGVGLGVYLTDAEGVVVFDSEGGRRVGEDYSEYNDVFLTLDGRYGARSSREIEDDAGSSVMYVGAPVLDEAGEIAGVLSVYKSQSDVYPFVMGRRRAILWAIALIGGGVILLVGATFLWLFRPIGKLTDYAQAVAEGGRPPMPKLGKGQEVNTLGTALNEMREALEGRHYVKNYVEGLTHELKSPLAAIKGAAELLDEDMPEEARARFSRNIRHECDRSERAIERLLALSAVEGQSQLEQVEAVDIEELIDRAIADCRTSASLRKVTLEKSGTGGGDGPSVQGDRVISRTALENLIENAIDFSPEGGAVEIEVKTDDECCRILVRDSGPGFPDYALERAFERFYSLRHQSKGGKKGTGLGLALVAETAELHGGKATVRNRPGGGAEAEIELPLG